MNIHVHSACADIETRINVYINALIVNIYVHNSKATALHLLCQITTK